MNTNRVSQKPRAGLFVTCAVDLMRPSVGFSSVRLLEKAGCDVIVPPQSCCGQIAYNNGLPEETRTLALQVVEAFGDVDYVVVPSGSCASMLKNHYPRLFNGQNRAVNDFADKVFELTVFLADVVNPPGIMPGDTGMSTTIAYHDSCAGLRELAIKRQPRSLISLRGGTVTEIPDGEVCCGFGGTFCVKFADISNRMVSDKTANVKRIEPDLLLGGDLTCLLNLAGKLQRQGNEKIQVRHIAEYLAGDSHTPAIGLKE